MKLTQIKRQVSYMDNYKDITCTECEGEGASYNEEGCNGNETRTVKQTCERCEGSGEITQHTNQIFEECDNLINNFNLAIDNMFGRTKLWATPTTI